MSHEKKRTLSFFITTKCNLNCSYCINDTRNVGKEKTIDLKFAKKGVDDFFKNRIDIFGNNNKIRFYGVGEPTTRMDLIKSIKNYAVKIKGKDLFVELQTNGYFTNSSARWIAENINEVWISIDGPKEIQNKNRPTMNGQESLSIVEKNIKYLLKNGVFVGARVTIQPQDNKKQIEIIGYLYSLGIKWIYTEPVYKSIKQNGKNGVKKITLNNLNEFVRYFVKAFRYAEKLNLHYGCFFTANFDEHCKYACRSCLPMPQLTADGYVSGCDLAYCGKTQLSEFIFGKYDKNKQEIIYYPEKINKIRQRNTVNIKVCKKCKLKNNCGGGCAGLAYYATENYLGVIKEFCEATKYLSKFIPMNKGCVKHLYP